MDEETAKRFTQSIIKWTLGILATIGILGTIFWLLFYSVYTANLSFIIPLRNWYQQTFWIAQEVFLPKNQRLASFKPAYTIQPVNQPPYTYAIFGKVVDLPNQRSNILAIETSNYKTYIFDLGTGLDYPIPEGTGLQILWSDKRSLAEIIKYHDDNPQLILNPNGSRIVLHINPVF